jgi:hypothetical protein
MNANIPPCRTKHYMLFLSREALIHPGLDAQNNSQLQVTMLRLLLLPASTSCVVVVLVNLERILFVSLYH